MRGGRLTGGASPSPTDRLEFVCGGLCRKENLVYVVGVDALGDPCDQRDRSAVGVGKKSVFVGETISLPRATCLRSIQNAPMMGNGVCARRGVCAELG